MKRACVVLGMALVVAMSVVGIARSQFPNFSLETTILGKFTSGSTVPAGDDNYNGPGDHLAILGGELSFKAGLSLSPNVGGVAQVTLAHEGTDPAEITLDRLYFNANNALGIQGLALRVGRDAITLGPIGLLLDGEFYDDPRDGIQVWLPQIGPLWISLFGQVATTDWTTRRVMGARAELTLREGWVLGFNVRSDTAGALDAGPCPGPDCATGTGFGVDLQSQLSQSVKVVIAYAAYTQTGDATRHHLQASLEANLEEISGLAPFAPVLSLWYKSLGPYTIPGGPGGTTPRGAFWTPDDFNLFNINDNLNAFGGRLSFSLPGGVEVFGIGESGRYRDGGPRYSLWSVGAGVGISSNITMKVSYNSYTVDGGTVMTSPVSGIQLGSVQVFYLEIEGTW